jgi:hypothetical protein
MMRQYIMCKADNTPLYVFGDDTAGDEQYRKCNDWNALRDYATENSACYRDTPPGVDKDTFPLGAHFGRSSMQIHFRVFALIRGQDFTTMGTTD